MLHSLRFTGGLRCERSLQYRHPELRTRHPELRTRHPELYTRHPKLQSPSELCTRSPSGIAQSPSSRMHSQTVTVTVYFLHAFLANFLHRSKQQVTLELRSNRPGTDVSRAATNEILVAPPGSCGGQRCNKGCCVAAVLLLCVYMCGCFVFSAVWLLCCCVSAVRLPYECCAAAVCLLCGCCVLTPRSVHTGQQRRAKRPSLRNR